MNDYQTTWCIKEDVFPTIGFGLMRQTLSIAKAQLPHFLEYFPFQRKWNCLGFKDTNLIIFQLISLAESGTPYIDEIKDAEFIKVCQELISSNKFPSFYEINSISGTYTPDTFTYIGKYEKGCASWEHTLQVHVDWLNEIVLPDIELRNQKKVLSAIPPAPYYNPEKILSNVFVIESTNAMEQGTCFHLKGIGLVSCHHAVFEDSIIFSHKDLSKKYPVKIINSNKVIDLAIISAGNFDIGEGLELGSADTLNILDHIAAVGFPNYNFGDSGVFIPGFVVGFRPNAGIRNILVSTPLIAGNSGGPIIDKNNKVVGVAVTGSLTMEEAGKTEKHAAVPIDALKFII